MPEHTDILIVDDSLIFRSAVAEALRVDDNFRVVGSVWNGVKALEFIRKRRPHLVTLDFEMPEMGGIETLQAIQEINSEDKSLPAIGVLMVSSHTRDGAESTIQALEAGAFDFITKPEGKKPEESLAILREQLCSKILAFGGVKQPQGAPKSVATPQPTVAKRPVRVRSTGNKAVLIGVSTGGPKALATFLPDLVARIHVPVFIVQHMPPVFTESMANSLDQKCKYTVIEASHEDVVDASTAYIAPGGKHMLVRKNANGEIITAITDQPPENNCKPSVDVLFRSAASIFGGDAIAVVLTGMGNDGTKGLAPLRRAGVRVIVQDEATSVVWGMPGSAVAADMVDQILPLDEIPAAIDALLNRK